jgi:hypothetical protein
VRGTHRARSQGGTTAAANVRMIDSYLAPRGPAEPKVPRTQDLGRYIYATGQRVLAGLAEKPPESRKSIRTDVDRA